MASRRCEPRRWICRETRPPRRESRRETAQQRTRWQTGAPVTAPQDAPQRGSKLAPPTSGEPVLTGCRPGSLCVGKPRRRRATPDCPRELFTLRSPRGGCHDAPSRGDGQRCRGLRQLPDNESGSDDAGSDQTQQQENRHETQHADCLPAGCRRRLRSTGHSGPDRGEEQPPSQVSVADDPGVQVETRENE